MYTYICNNMKANNVKIKKAFVFMGVLRQYERYHKNVNKQAFRCCSQECVRYASNFKPSSKTKRLSAVEA